MKKSLFLLFIAVSALAGAEPAGRIPVVPYPQQVTPGTGYFAVPKGEIALRISGVEEATREVIAAQLWESFLDRYGKEPVASVSRNPVLWIGIPGTDEHLAEIAASEGILPGPGLGEEGYILHIGKDRIYITAATTAGAFYGVQTLRQLLRGYPGPEQLPAMTIRDWPGIAFRCVMDDISRGPIPTNEYMRQQVRRYAELKINHMSFYIEHVVRTASHPDFAPSDGGIPVEEFRELSEYAAAYQVKLVGSFQSLGHFEKILSFPQYRHLGATERMLDPLNPEAMEFLSAIYTDMAPAFSSELFTPNCDEAWDLSRGQLTVAAASMGVDSIYAAHVTRIDSVLRGLGKRTLIWGDIILEHPGILEMIPEHMVIGAWDYSASGSFASFIDPIRDAGFDFTVSPGVLNSNRLIPDFGMTAVNIRNFINEGYEKGALGVYCTVWDDGGMHFFSRDWYGVAYNADHSWRPNRDPLEDFDARFSRGIYGDRDTLVPRTLHTLNRLTDLGPTYEMNSGIFWQTLVPGRGENVTFDPGSWNEVHRWAAEARDILTGRSTPAYDLDLAFIKFTINQYLFMAVSREELLRAADAYSRACGIQLADRHQALIMAREARDIAGSLRYRFERLMDDFGILWELENRPYWRDRAETDYRRRLEDFTDLGRLLDGAIGQFASGGFLPPPTEVRLDIRKQSGQYFQYWLLAGSFPLDSFENSSRDFLVAMGGEAGAQPYPGMQFTDETGTLRTWMKYDSPSPAEINLREVFEPGITAVAYAYCTIDSPADQQVTALLGSNDGATVWCNGEKVHHIHVKRSLIRDEDEIPLDLKQGRNHILVKVEQWKADWGFSFRLKDRDVRNHKQKYAIVSVNR